MSTTDTNEPCWQLTLTAGDDCLLRPLRIDDADALHAAAMDTVAELRQWFDWCHVDWTTAEALAVVEHNLREQQSGRSYNFVAVDAHGRIVGSTWLNRVDGQHRFCNLGYWVRTPCAGRGIATRAAQQLARWGFDHLGLTRIEIVVDVDNAASHRVATKIGARREGLLRWRLVHHGQPHDAVMYSLLPRDFDGTLR
ncbi:MAG: GNAT family N-acetyltransferase [Pirellulales bacterium]|nr:GNAT family N-acetyltransferase [Pirellulales bacterium]